VRFYRDVVGFDLVAQLGDQAAFLSAGGYHHHIGANTWESRGAAPAPVGMARLTQFTIVVPDDDERARIVEAVGGELRDPSGNAFALVT
jgi:catechol 2,3-dioxygenase